MPVRVEGGTHASPRPSDPLAEIAAGAGRLELGARGDAVTALQQALQAAGADLVVDGRFGPRTQAAVRAYQRGVGAEVDGVVGAETAGHLVRGTVPAPAPEPTLAPPAAQPHPPALPYGGAARPLQTTGVAELGLPQRPPGAATGSEFLQRTRHLSGPEREQAILQEVLSGNVPAFARQLHEVTTTMLDAAGRRHEAVLRVAADYLAIGSDGDHVRIPMSPLTAQRIADATGASLPTRAIADAVFRQAAVKLAPQPMRPGREMTSNGYYATHERKIEQQLGDRAPGALTAGHKKDVVLSAALQRQPERVAIYGWHQPDGRAIQPLSTVHENTYADYSHGVRLVAGTVTVDGVERPLAELLRDPALARLVSDEGPLALTRVPGAP